MRISKTLFTAFFLLFSITPAHAVEIPAVFNFQGTGYGHGVGLSQIGARGKALAGESAQSILSQNQRLILHISLLIRNVPIQICFSGI